MIPLTNEENKRISSLLYIARKNLVLMTIKYEITVITLASIEALLMIFVIWHSQYDYHFIIKELAKKFEGQLECPGENTRKYATFSVTLKKKLENGNTVTYKIKFIVGFKFMSSSLSSIVDNLAEGLRNSKCKDCKSCLEYIKIDEDTHFIFKCFKCNKT